jgi:hypothetical protein
MMRRLTHTLVLLTAATALAAIALPPLAAAKPDGKSDSKKAPATTVKAPPAGVTANACGCYRTEAGSCLCGDKKAKCECPGDCEPIGCETKRAKEVDREIAAETKKAQEEEKKRQAAEAAAAAAREAPPPDESAQGDDAEPANEKAEKADSRKPRRKPAAKEKESQAKNK